MHKLIEVDEDQIIKPSTVKDLGGREDVPTPWKRIKRSEFLDRLTHFTPVAMGHRQPYKGSRSLGNLTLFYYEDNIYGMVRKWKATKFIFKFYVFGCDHSDIKEETIGNCLHKHTCRGCGETWTIDSSG